MTIRIHTSTGQVLRGYVLNSHDAAKLLMQLANEGTKCVRWVIE